MPDEPAPSPGWAIEKLVSDHNRSSFSTGFAQLDDYIKKYASQNQKRGISQTYVAVRPNEKAVCGYYSISAGSVEFSEVPDDLRKRLPRYPVPVAHLGKLAVDVKSRGQGLGEFLLLDALERIMRASDIIAVHAVEVVAIDDRARGFYEKYGFVSLLDDRNHLYLPLHLIEKLGLV